MADETKTETTGFKLPDPAEIGRSMADIAERSQRIVSEWLKRQANEEHAPDPLNIASAFMEMTARLITNPARLVAAQLGFWQDYMTLWQNTARRIMGAETEPVIDAPSTDRRFKDDAWRENEVFDFIKQSYLLSARYVQDVVKQVDGLDPKTAQKVDFYARQFVDAMSPSNFLLTNPEVLRKTAETGGENLLRGLNNLLSDLEQGKGKLRIKMTDMAAFKLGENIGVSPGKVVLPERPDAAHSVHAEYREGTEAAAADRAALDQQVLHSGSAAAEQLRPLGGVAGPYRLHDLLGEPGREARREELRGLHGGRLSRRTGCDRAGDR